jgi:hypothetical protein
MKKIFAVRVGDMEKPIEKKMLEKQSPLNSAKNIKSPLFVVQGANDPRVKKAESDQIVVALRDLGRAVEYIVAPDEGHGFAGKENRIAMYTAMEQFFAKHLNGRVQKEVRDVIQNKLDAITVDVKMVVLDKPEAKEISATMPEFNGALVKPDTLKYTIKMEIQGQRLTMNSTRKIVKTMQNGLNIWRVIEEVSSAMGSGIDTLELDAVTLLPVRRSAMQGPGKITVEFSGKSINGKMSMGLQEMPIKAQTENNVLSDGMGVELPIATLHLAVEYTATIYQFDIMMQKEKAMVLTIPASENVTVSAGTFDTFKVVLTPRDGDSGGSTIWIDKATRRIVKGETKLPPQAGGGMAYMELTK